MTRQAYPRTRSRLLRSAATLFALTLTLPGLACTLGTSVGGPPGAPPEGAPPPGAPPTDQPPPGAPPSDQADQPAPGQPPTDQPPPGAPPTDQPPPGAPPTDQPPPGDPPDASDCGGKQCAQGETCVSYYGIAGPKGPKFMSCEIPCNPKKPDACPKGKRCTTIADGPGPVCR